MLGHRDFWSAKCVFLVCQIDHLTIRSYRVVILVAET